MRIQNYIVILQYNKFYLTSQLLEDLEKHEKENIDKIILVDNGSTDPEKSSVMGEWSKKLPIDIEILEKNVGFVLGFNHGLKLATGDFAEPRAVFAISNDVRIHGKFIQQANDLLFSARRVFVGNRHIVFNSGWNQFDGIVYDYLEGYFLATTSDGWRDIGYFDEQFAPCDFEDVDISTTAKRKGYKLTSLNNPNIVHLVAQTYGYNSEREAQTLRNQEIFRRKWTKE